jgi:hypothetical protein
LPKPPSEPGPSAPGPSAPGPSAPGPSAPGPSAEAVETIVSLLRDRSDLRVEAGLSPAELTSAEQQFGVQFPPLWRAVLGACHPVALSVPPRGPDGVLRWTAVPDWRGRDTQATSELVEAPVAGVLFDVEVNDFWWAAWGRRPRRRTDRVAAAREHLASVPRLVPLWGHQYVSSDDRSPVLSVVQTDLYRLAADLGALLRGQAHADNGPTGTECRIEFWSDLLDWSQGG